MPEIGYLRHESGNLFSGGEKDPRVSWYWTSKVMMEQTEKKSSLAISGVGDTIFSGCRYRFVFVFHHKIFRQGFNPDRELLPLFVFPFL